MPPLVLRGKNAVHRQRRLDPIIGVLPLLLAFFGRYLSIGAEVHFESRRVDIMAARGATAITASARGLCGAQQVARPF